MKKAPGFTFAEILLVTLIVMIIATFSIPQFKRTYDHLTYLNSVENFLSLCHYARETAVLRREPFWVCVDVKENSFWLGRNYEVDGETVFSRLRGRYGKPEKVPQRVTLYASHEKIPFYPDGGSVDALVTFRDESGDYSRVEINEVTGRVGLD